MVPIAFVYDAVIDGCSCNICNNDCMAIGQGCNVVGTCGISSLVLFNVNDDDTVPTAARTGSPNYIVIYVPIKKKKKNTHTHTCNTGC